MPKPKYFVLFTEYSTESVLEYTIFNEEISVVHGNTPTKKIIALPCPSLKEARWRSKDGGQIIKAELIA